MYRLEFLFIWYFWKKCRIMYLNNYKLYFIQLANLSRAIIRNFIIIFIIFYYIIFIIFIILYLLYYYILYTKSFIDDSLCIDENFSTVINHRYQDGRGIESSDRIPIVNFRTLTRGAVRGARLHLPCASARECTDET